MKRLFKVKIKVNHQKKDNLKIDPKPNMGYLGKIDDYRKIFEKLFKT